MIHEYALDPEALTNWENTRYLLDQFGVPHGRLISQFPKNWKRRVYDACTACSPLDKKRIEERLARADAKLMRNGRHFDSQQEWVPNALRAHQEAPFRLIISHRASASGEVVAAAQIGPETPGWIPDGGEVLRTPEALATVALPLFSGAKMIRFVDPHYSCGARHNKPLQKMVEVVRFNCSSVVIEYHFLQKGATADWFSGELKGDRLKWVRNALGDHVIHFVRWNCYTGGENFHARYILTDRGGLQYENGLDEGNAGETTDIFRMDEALYKKRWSAFNSDAEIYDFCDAWCLSSGGVRELKKSEIGIPLG